ncbi:MAG: L,D-transpeptidase [Pseudolabrys sp.]|nr:L,D-transpeptidase [Pseudolabrys sp.]
MPVRRFARVLAALCALALSVFVQPARAELSIAIDKSRQQMTVALNGAPLFVWPVSTGAPGYDTPSGAFTPFRMERTHFSREWDDAPMPHSVFFTRQGHAIHGSNHLKAIGTPASHGCVRLEPKNARILFDLVKQEGMQTVRVTLSGETPERGAAQVARRGDGIMSDDGDTVGSVPPRRRVMRQDYYGRPRYYYYGESPYYPPRRSRAELPFELPFFGR